jgi:hypothetical protein
VKVGRRALDEEAIRRIEEHNPDIEFDWPMILEAPPLPAVPAADDRNRRVRRDRTDRRRPAAQPPAVDQPTETTPNIPPEPEALELLVVEEVLEQLTHPDTEEHVAPAEVAVDRVIGGEQLVRLRARYAELQARITERGGDAARIDTLRAQADSLDPDMWVTEEQVRKGLEEFEPKIRDLRAALGLRRRRRSRRGGRKRQGEGSPKPDQTPAGSDSSDAGEPQDSPAAIEDDGEE